MWNQQVEVLHHHLTGPMGVSPHNTSYKSFASWFMNVLAFGVNKSSFESYHIWLKIGTVAVLYRDLKTWCIMAMITMTITTRPNLSTWKIGQSLVKCQAGYRRDPGNPTQDPRWEWRDPALGGGIPPFPPGMKIWSHLGSRI